MDKFKLFSFSNTSVLQTWIIFVLFATPLIPQIIFASPEQPACKQCNILMLNIDFLRSDYVVLHNDSTLTPNIDDFFREGLIFKNIYSPSGSTYRGNLSVFTATNPFLYSLDVKTFELLRGKPEFRYWKEIYTSQMTLAERMQSAGYHTAMLNKGTRSGKGTILNRGYDTYKQFPMRVLIEDQIDHLFTQIKNIPEPFFIHFHAIPTRLHRAYFPQHRQRIKDKNIITSVSNEKSTIPSNITPLETRKKMTSLRKTIARNLVAAKNETAMLTTINEVDMSAILDMRKELNEDFQKKYGIKLGFMSLFGKAVCWGDERAFGYAHLTLQDLYLYND